MNLHQVGDMVRITGNFVDLGGNPIDPTSVAIDVTKPSGESNTYEYPDDVTRDSTGVYYAFIDVDEPGQWMWSWVSTGNGQGADNGTFYAEGRQ